MTEGAVKLKPNPEKVAVALADCSMDRVKFVLTFVSRVIARLRNGTLRRWDWCALADDLGILSEVTKVIECFDLPEDEFFRCYPHLIRHPRRGKDVGNKQDRSGED